LGLAEEVIMYCIHRQPRAAAVRAIVHTIVTIVIVAVMVIGAFGTFEMFGGVVRASEGITSEGITGGCSAGADQRYRLRVRLVPSPSRDVDAETVQTEVAALWRDYGVDIIWEGRWDERAAGSKPDLFVYFVDRELHEGPHRGASAVAWIVFFDGVPGPVINVSVAAADRLLKNTPWLDGRPMRLAPQNLQDQLISTMIGRALAHEIGHYLLASTTHASDGLMRPMITPAEFVRIGRKHLKLMPSDVSALRAARLANCQLSASR
jgi:hypothetical protein